MEDPFYKSGHILPQKLYYTLLVLCVHGYTECIKHMYIVHLVSNQALASADKQKFSSEVSLVVW